MTFKEQLKNDIDRLGTTEEFRNSLSEMLFEQAEKPKPKLYISAVRYGAVAAAVCLLAFGAVKLGLFQGDSLNTSVTLSGKDAAERSGDVPETLAAQSYEEDTAAADIKANKSDEGASEEGLDYTAAADDEIYIENADGYDDYEVEKTELYVGENYSEDEAAYDLCAEEASSNEQIAEDVLIDSAAGSFSPESIAASVYDAPVYSGEPIYAEVSTYCSDRPWYSAEEMAQNVQESGYRLARVKFGEALTDEEAKRQTGINSGFEGTYFHAQADGEDIVVYFFGSSQVQEVDNPVYAEGDEIYCALEEKNGVYMIREYPLGDIYTVGGEECVYLRIQPCELDAPQLISGSISVTTTTAGNPARYYSAYRLEDFQREFLRLVAQYGGKAETALQEQ